ncbi:uncharacterized protein LOC121878880 [Homarus americanus]|uniref:Endo-1-4-beta-xylanase B-like 6 n=1 Tax=Homarus americanus TaxID=6706 RepID=A0A8J5MNX2_HOMAM|nr:uncharacterized protein LOC121878880 [Homarus americanus]XP_042241242.1 uncharacterized protein LOC121878880 [Homarus americanus]KAG7158359.1 Endo-1-4-beta-xylanase B-like 6 [Homarus americanus]
MSAFTHYQPVSVMDPVASESVESTIKVEVKEEEPEYIYVDESVCRVKLEEQEDDLVLPKEEETARVVADVGLFGSHQTILQLQPSRTRGRRRKIHQKHKPKSNAVGTTVMILPRPQIQVPNLNITHAPLPISHLQPATQCPPKQMTEPMPEHQSSGTQTVSLKTASLPKVATNSAGAGRKILPRPHIPTSLVHPQQQTVPLQQSVNTSSVHQGTPLNQIHSISPGNNCNIIPIHQLQSALPSSNHTTLPVPQLNSSTVGHCKKTIAISNQKATIPTIVTKPMSVPQLKSTLPVSCTRVSPATHIQSAPADCSKTVGHIQQKQSTKSGVGRKLLLWPKQPSIRQPSGMIIHPQQQSVSLQHLQTLTPVSMHQTVPLQQMQSIPTSSSQQTLPIHQLRSICSVSTPQNIPVQQIQTLNTQQSMTLHPLQNTASVTTHQSLPLQPLQAIPSVSSHQPMPVQHLQNRPSRNSHQTIPLQQIHTVPSGCSQQTMQVQTIASGSSQAIPMQQVQTIPQGNTQQNMPIQHLHTMTSAHSRQNIPVQNLQTITSRNSQQSMAVQHIQTMTTGSSHQNMSLQNLQTLTSVSSHQNIQNLQTITSRSSHETMPMQQLQSVPSGNSHQIMPLQQLRAIPSVTTCQVTPIQHVQPIAPASAHQTMSLQQLQTLAPASQQQNIPLQQLSSITPVSTQQIMPLQQFSNSHSSLPLHQIQALPHASNQQAIPLQQISSVNPNIAQHTSPIQPLQQVPQPNGPQTLPVQQLQPVNQGNAQTNLPLQQLQTSLPSASTHQPHIHYLQSDTSSTSQNMSFQQQLQSISCNGSNQTVQFRSPSCSQNQAAIHQVQPAASTEAHQTVSLHCVAPSKTNLKVPIQPIKTYCRSLINNRLKRLHQQTVSPSCATFKNRPILKVGSVASYAVEKNIKIHEKKLFISGTNDKVTPVVPLQAATPGQGRKILPRPPLPSTSCAAFCKILPKQDIQSGTLYRTIVVPSMKSSVDTHGQNLMSIPELQSTTSSLTHKNVVIQQPEQSNVTATDKKSVSVQQPLSSATVCDFVPSCEQKSDSSECNVDTENDAQSPEELVVSSDLQHQSACCRADADQDGQGTTGVQCKSSPPSECEGPNLDTCGMFSPVPEEESVPPDIDNECASSPQENIAATDECNEIESCTSGTSAACQQSDTQGTANEYSENTQQKYEKTVMNVAPEPQSHQQLLNVSGESSVLSQEQDEVSHIDDRSLPVSHENCASEVLPKDSLPSVTEHITNGITHHGNQLSCSNISTSSYHCPEGYMSLEDRDNSYVIHEEQEGNMSENESEYVNVNEPGKSSPIASHSLCYEREYDSSDTASDLVPLMPELCQSSSISDEFTSTHSQHFDSTTTVQVTSHPQPLYDTIEVKDEPLPVYSHSYADPSEKQYSLFQSSNVNASAQPMSSPALYSNVNAPGQCTIVADIKPELQVGYAVSNTLENNVSSQDLQYHTQCSVTPTLPFQHSQDEIFSNGNLTYDQKQCSSTCVANLPPVSVTHHPHSSTSNSNDFAYQNITSTTFSTACNYIPTPALQQSVSGASGSNYWINSHTQHHHPKVSEELNYSHLQDQTSEDVGDGSVCHQLQGTLQAQPNEYSNQEKEQVDETICQEDVLNQECSQAGNLRQHFQSNLKKCFIRKRRRELMELSKMKVTLMSHKKTIRTLWKKFKIEKRKNSKLREKLVKGREGKTDNGDTSDNPNLCGVEKGHELSATKTKFSRKMFFRSEPLSTSTRKKGGEKNLDIFKRIITFDSEDTDEDVKDFPPTLKDNTSSCTSENELQCLIQEFMMLDDVSQMSKKTFTSSGKTKPIRYRLHFLSVLHKRFIADCCKSCSFQTFCEYIPCNVLKCKADELDSCLCMTCQNPELKIESMVKRRYLSMNTNIEEIIEDEEAFKSFIKILRSLKSHNALLTYTTWSVGTSGSGPLIPRKKSLTRSLGEVSSLLESELYSLKDHIKRTYRQYEAAYEAKCEAAKSALHSVIQTGWSPLIILQSASKKDVPDTQTVISLQSGYMWSDLESTGFVALSDSNDRTSAAVCASLEKVLKRVIKDEMATLTFVVDPQTHISGVRECARKYGVEVKCIFLEPGHGHGVAEAVGNSITQLICDTINANGNSVICSARDVFHLINSHSSNLVYFYTADDICRLRELLHLGSFSKSGHKFIKPKIVMPLQDSNT